MGTPDIPLYSGIYSGYVASNSSCQNGIFSNEKSFSYVLILCFNFFTQNSMFCVTRFIVGCGPLDFLGRKQNEKRRQSIKFEIFMYIVSEIP